MRKLTLVWTGLLALALAGTGETAVRGTVFTITAKHFARLAGTDVYCKNVQG